MNVKQEALCLEGINARAAEVHDELTELIVLITSALNFAEQDLLDSQTLEGLEKTARSVISDIIRKLRLAIEE